MNLEVTIYYQKNSNPKSFDQVVGVMKLDCWMMNSNSNWSQNPSSNLNWNSKMGLGSLMMIEEWRLDGSSSVSGLIHLTALSLSRSPGFDGQSSWMVFDLRVKGLRDPMNNHRVCLPPEHEVG